MRARATPRLLAAGAGAALALIAAPGAAVGVRAAEAGRSSAVQRPQAVAAAFARRSYAPGAHAELVLWSAVREVGIEIDARTPWSPRSVAVAARVPHVFGLGRSAEMAYYETPRGAKVFAAGTLNFGGSAWYPIPRRLIENV